MKFGLLYLSDYHAESYGDPSRYYGHILDQAQLAENWDSGRYGSASIMRVATPSGAVGNRNRRGGPHQAASGWAPACP